MSYIGADPKFLQYVRARANPVSCDVSLDACDNTPGCHLMTRGDTKYCARQAGGVNLPTVGREYAIKYYKDELAKLEAGQREARIEALLKGEGIERKYSPGTRTAGGRKRVLTGRGERGGISQRFGDELRAYFAAQAAGPPAGGAGAGGAGAGEVKRTFAPVAAGPYPVLGTYDGDEYDGAEVDGNDSDGDDYDGGGWGWSWGRGHGGGWGHGHSGHSGHGHSGWGHGHNGWGHGYWR